MAFLNALEQSHSVSPTTGWSAQHLTLWSGSNLDAACPLYSKNHSYGEYIFDWAWAEAYQRHGVHYYPKFVASSPFTPATGPKILVRPGVAINEAYATLLTAARELTETNNHSSLHFLFLSPDEVPQFERAGFLVRHSFQYHWKNRAYKTFEDFLEHLKPRKRKQIIRERAQLAEEGLKIRFITGEELTAKHAEIFYPLYRATTDKMRAIAYLTPDFFARVFEAMKQNVVLIVAEDKEETVAAALYYQKGKNLYGRYWGASREVRNLHFELCYYQPIEWAIKTGLSLFEAGAQGEHKISRGFLPELTYSAHWIRHPAFREAIAHFIEEEKKGIAALFVEMEPHLPFKN